jgi:retron-type reverse transcriptase
VQKSLQPSNSNQPVQFKQHGLERIFHLWSFGYRPGRTPLQAVGQARRNSWKCDWVIDLDIKGFFDTIDHELLMRALERHVSERWIRLYVRRWLKSPVEAENGRVDPRDRGTPHHPGWPA